ncbi:MAG: SNF2-related protein [Waddliaceae bacterium]
MLNFRTLKKDFSPSILKEGRELYEKKVVLSAKILHLTAQSVRLSCKVLGNFDHSYECEIEMDRQDSTIMDSDCNCTYTYDCQHLAAVIFYLEEYLDKLVVEYSKEANIEKSSEIDAKEKATLRETFKEAETKEVARRGKKEQKEMLQEYVCASEMLGKSPFFLPEENLSQDSGELLIIFSHPSEPTANVSFHQDIQLALRLPYRSKPLNIPNVKKFLEAINYAESIYIGSKRFNFSLLSFGKETTAILKMLIDHVRHSQAKEEHNPRNAQIDGEAFGMILALAHQKAAGGEAREGREPHDPTLPGLFCGSLEEPLRFSNSPALLRVELEYLEAPAPKILLNPTIVVEDKIITILEEARLFECTSPGMIYQNTYYRFEPHIRRNHLGNLSSIREITIPEPLFGTFVENALPELMRFAEVANQENIDRFVTLPYTGRLEAECNIHYLNGELEASLYFIYDNNKVPAAHSQLHAEDLNVFVSSEGIIARNLSQERKIIEELFQDFVFDSKQGVFCVKSERKIVEFMTEVIPQAQKRVKFNCPENLLDQFLYDETTFNLKLKETKFIDAFEVDLVVDGHLNGVTVDLLWECVVSKRAFIELSRMHKERKKKSSSTINKILVLDLEKLASIVQIFDELGINRLDNHTEKRPTWSLASIDPSQFKGLPFTFSMSKKLKEIQQQMLGSHTQSPRKIPSDINAKLRKYQEEGSHWLERLREMHLNGILADDMGLGKTLQAIVSLTQYKEDQSGNVSLVVCPTSLVHNWKEEVSKFNPKLKALPIDGTPPQRKKLLAEAENCDVIITSYSLLQKDIELYKNIQFGYVILDEAQHIKNRSTRNAKSVKILQCSHRLILTGTPIENSLEELWSLFDFLMPGFLSSYDRFLEKYIRSSTQGKDRSCLETLRRKVGPFILRRMKKDVLSELPPVSEIIYHCHLSEEQKRLYRSYARSARKELAKLVKKEGFDKIQIHVLATLTRLKQICCHPAIFAKEKPEEGDSAKYDMLLELIQTLIESKHKTVIFSQYTRMLQIMRKDLQAKGIRFEYLDGSSKNRLDIVNRFNDDRNVPVFLVSLKAGGSGLNLVGADTVIHYDMWWNPAVENQATDRVHRIGQKNSVSSYKLITLGTIEEKILELQDRKKGLVQKVLTTDEEAIAKLTWEEVLELLQT